MGRQTQVIDRVISDLITGEYDDGEHPIVTRAINDLREAVKDPTICNCQHCGGVYSRHIRVSPTLLLNVQYICDSETGNAIMAVELDGEIIPKIRDLFRPTLE